MKVQVYVKPDCSLCLPMMRTVEKVQGELGFAVEKVDISKDPALLEAYGHEIPVVFINGKKAFKYRVSEQELKKKLKRAHKGDLGNASESHHDDENPSDATALLEEEPFIPPRPFALLLVTIALAFFGYFVAVGFTEAVRARQEPAH